ncbi:MAG TPA: ABC transporter ATP-binding protein [Acholeplasma sp.]|nr:ABC transporter ATP-binding protein [Acholeplasma sp.]
MIFRRHFTKYYFKYLWAFLIGIAVLVLIDYIQLLIPESVGLIIDELDKDTINRALMVEKITHIIYITLIIVFGRFLWRVAIFGTSRRIEYEIRNKMFLHATRLPQSFYSQEKVGGLMTYFINDLEALRMAYGPGILMLIDGLVLGGLAVYKMFSLQKTLTYYAAIPMVLLIIVMVLTGRIMQMKYKARQGAFESLSDFTQENFSGITVIKAYVREIKEAMFFRKKNLELYDKDLNFVKTMILVQISISIAINAVILVIIGYGGYAVLYSGLSIGDLTAYLSYFFTLIWPTMALAQFISIHNQAKASSKRIGAFLDEKVTVTDELDSISVSKLRPRIRANNLTFKYPDGDKPVLKNVNFEINEGEMVGILGRTGSGKSSLVDLLLRIYNLDRDMLFIDEYDIMKLKIKEVRDLIGYVPQDNFLFSDTIYNNIGFSHDIVDKEVVHDSAKLADVYDNIMDFSDQFDTVLGERGTTVSGGQKQRISIARALAKNPEILILDDSVSAVDTKTEEAIIKNLHKVRKGKTTIFIAHRISTVKRMDKIILLDQGEIVAIGNHKTLLKTSPLYQDMVKRQELESMVKGEEVHA